MKPFSGTFYLAFHKWFDPFAAPNIVSGPTVVTKNVSDHVNVHQKLYQKMVFENTITIVRGYLCPWKFVIYILLSTTETKCVPYYMLLFLSPSSQTTCHVRSKTFYVCFSWMDHYVFSHWLNYPCPGVERVMTILIGYWQADAPLNKHTYPDCFYRVNH